MEINKIYQGDCLEVMPSISGKSIDMILCDLPYGTTACKWDTIIPFESLWEQYKRIIGTTGVACQNLKRNFILIEKEPKYIEVINSRLALKEGKETK